jgi:hypothetical protein
VWIVLVVSPLPLLAFLPMVRNGVRIYAAHAWNRPEAGFLREAYDLLLPGGLLAGILLVGATMVCLKRGRDAKPDAGARFPKHEIAAALALLGLPVVAFVLAVTVVGMVNGRYALAAVIGFAVLFALVTATATRSRPSAAVLISALILVLFGGKQVVALRAMYEERNRFRAAAFEAALRNYDHLPVAVQDGIAVLPLAHYGSPELVSRLYFVYDDDAIHRYATNDSAEKNLYVGRDYFPIRVDSLENLCASHREFLVYGAHAGWLLSALTSSGARVRIVYSGRYEMLFLVTQNAAGVAPVSGNGSDSFRYFARSFSASRARCAAVNSSVS